MNKRLVNKDNENLKKIRENLISAFECLYKNIANIDSNGDKRFIIRFFVD